MTTRIFCILLFSTTLLFSCKKDDDNSGTPGNGTFDDFGYLPAPASDLVSFQNMAVSQNHLYVASADGIWKTKTTEKNWQAAGLQGKKVISVFAHPSRPGTLFAGILPPVGSSEKTLYRSTDGGANWQVVDATPFEPTDNYHEKFYCFAVRPGQPDQIFANIEGAGIAVSKDGGLTWTRKNQETEASFNYDCAIAFLSTDPNHLFQGAESPLDFAWLGKYRLDAADPVNMSDLQKVVGDNLEWENRRPNCLRHFDSNPGVFYVGQEGALSKVSGSQWKYIFEKKMSNDPTDLPYTYVKGIWLNPNNPKHLIFGGGINGINTTLSLFETLDEGKNIVQIKDRQGMTDPEIIAMEDVGGYPAILCQDKSNDKLRLMIYKF